MLSPNTVRASCSSTGVSLRVLGFMICHKRSITSGKKQMSRIFAIIRPIRTVKDNRLSRLHLQKHLISFPTRIMKAFKLSHILFLTEPNYSLQNLTQVTLDKIAIYKYTSIKREVSILCFQYMPEERFQRRSSGRCLEIFISSLYFFINHDITRSSHSSSRG